MADFNRLGSALIDAKAAKVKAEDAAKAAGTVVEDAEKALFEAMIDAEVDRVSVEGYTFSPDLKEYFNVPAEKMTSFYRAMLNKHLGSIWKRTVNAQTLQATLRELSTNNGGELPAWAAKYASVYTKTKISMRKTGGK